MKPLSFKMSGQADKGKGVSVASQKRKANLTTTPSEKLMRDAFGTRPIRRDFGSGTEVPDVNTMTDLFIPS